MRFQELSNFGCRPSRAGGSPFLLGLAVYIPHATEQAAIDAAKHCATQSVRQYKTIRAYYTKNVIKKVLAGSDLKPHFEHKDNPERIPLPATLIHDLGHELSDKGIMDLKLYSKYPFPNRKDRRLDDFANDAWQALKSNPKKPFSRTENINGETVVRVAIGDTMVAQGCVD